MTTRDVAVQSLRALLAQKQLSSGGWAALSPSSQTALEPTALACIALGRTFKSVHNRATAFLSGIQNPNGSWPVFPGDDQKAHGLRLLCSSPFMTNLKLFLNN